MSSQSSDIKKIMEQIVQFTKDRDWEKIWHWLCLLKLQN